MIDLRSLAALRLQVLLVCTLLGIYLLILLPVSDSADGYALSAVAASWVRSGSPNMNAVTYIDEFMPIAMGQMGTLGIDGAVYAKKGVTPSIFLTPLVVLADLLPWLTTRTTLMLFNPLITTATALLLFRFVVTAGYRLRTGLVIALAFGTATVAFVYAKSSFGEPLAGLLLLIAVMLIYQNRSVFNCAAAGIALGLLVGINTIYVVFCPLLMLLLWRWRSLRTLICFAAPIVIAVLLIGLYNAARFGSPLSSGYRFSDGEGFIVPIAIGMYGLFLSPYRGLFWYSPLLLLALPGWWMLRKSHRWLSWTILALVVVQGLAFAGWWSWHGGVVWGPRFLLPILPLLTLALAPLVDAMWSRKLLLFSVAAFCALSVFIVCLGAFYSYLPYIELYLNTQYATGDFTSIVTGYREEVLYDPTISPIIGHLAMLVAGIPLEPGWIRAGDWAYLLIPGGLVVAGIVQLFIPLGRRLRVALTAILIALALQGAVLKIADRQPMEAFEAAFQPAGTIVAATTVFQDALLDFEQNVPIITMSAPSLPDDEGVRSLWDYALRQRDILWFVNWFAPSDARNWQERALWQSAAFVVEREVLDHRALLFDLHPDPLVEAAGWKFGDIALDAYGVQIHPHGVQVLLSWSASEAPLKHLNWFVHLLDSSGNIVAQQDRQPQGGYSPTETWSTGEIITDRLFFLTSAAPDPETWRLRVGWVDPTTSTLLNVVDAQGNAQTDSFAILGLEMQSNSR